jgi:hypothetical protein
MLTAGGVATGELLRITQPRVRETVAPALTEPVFVPSPSIAPVAALAVRDTHPDLAAAVGEIETLAEHLRNAGEAARKVTVLGTGKTESVTLTALTLARLLGRQAKVVLVDLSDSPATLKAVSNDPAAPGLAELMLGEASFGQVITKDKMSALHLVSSGKPGADRALLQSPRLTLALDALLRVYDHVLLDAGTASDLPAELLTAKAQAVVVPDPAMATDARSQMSEQLKAVGFSAVTMLSKPSQPADAIALGARTVAA